MNVLLAVLFLGSPMVSILGPITIALLVGLIIFCAGCGMPLTGGEVAAISIVGGAIPFAACLSAALVRRILERADKYTAGFELLAMTLATALALQGSGATALFGAAGYIGTISDRRMLLGVSTLALSNALFVAGVAAFAVVAVAAITEFLTGWVTRAGKFPVRLATPAVRQLVAIVAICASVNLLIGLCSRELEPLTILHGFSR